MKRGLGTMGGSPGAPWTFKSMEDLVQEFDEKLTVCFRNYDATTEGLAPVRGRLQAQEEEEHLQDEE